MQPVTVRFEDDFRFGTTMPLKASICFVYIYKPKYTQKIDDAKIKSNYKVVGATANALQLQRVFCSHFSRWERMEMLRTWKQRKKLLKSLTVLRCLEASTEWWDGRSQYCDFQTSRAIFIEIGALRRSPVSWSALIAAMVVSDQPLWLFSIILTNFCIIIQTCY